MTLFKNSSKEKVLSETTTFWLSVSGGILVLILISLIVFWLSPKVRIELKILGPDKVRAGEETTFEVVAKNKGNVILENCEVVFQYPKGAISEKAPLETIKIEGKFLPKEEKKFQFKMAFLGKEGEIEDLKAWLNFSPKGKEIVKQQIVSFPVTIAQVPIDLVLDLPEKVEVIPKQTSNLSFRIKYLSLSTTTFSNLKLKVETPPSFTFQESNPVSENLQFDIEKLESGQGGEVEILGKVQAKENEEFPVKVSLVSFVRGEEILLKEVEKRGVTFIPNFFVYQKINGEENFLPFPGQRLHYQIFFKNLQDKPALNLELTVVLEGNLFDFNSIEAPNGEFHPGDNSISWSGEKVSSLRYLTPGEEGNVDFWIKLKNDYLPKDKGDFNPKISSRVFLAGFGKTFTNKVHSLVKISQEGYYHDKYQIFENTGPFPPRVGEATTYTLVWRISNYYNQLENVKVSAYLPSYVKVKTQKAESGSLKIIGSEERVSRYPEIPSDFRFTTPLYYGVRSNDVYYLQIILQEEVPTVYKKTTPITGYFGNVTLSAVKAFQIKFKDEILTPQGLKEAPGYVDELTMKKLNELLAKGLPGGETQIVWELPKIEPGTGVFSQPLMAAFQVEVVPSMKQRGLILTLIKEVNLVGIDQWTTFLVYAKDDAVDTTLPDDPLIEDHSNVQVR